MMVALHLSQQIFYLCVPYVPSYTFQLELIGVPEFLHQFGVLIDASSFVRTQNTQLPCQTNVTASRSTCIRMALLESFPLNFWVFSFVLCQHKLIGGLKRWNSSCRWPAFYIFLQGSCPTADLQNSITFSHSAIYS